MEIAVLTPDKELYTGEIRSVIVPGLSGQFEILDNHAPIVSALGSGRIVITPNSGEKLEYNISKGFVEVLRNKVSVMVQGVTE